MKTYIIAEAGVNHNGNLDIALKMIEAAKQCGCDCVKFQTFHTDALVTKSAKKANYQITNTNNTDNQYSMLKKLELSNADFAKLKEHCEKCNIDFLSTPFDIESVELLEQIGVNKYKMSSGDITNKQLLEYVAKKGKPIILSTGMSTMEEVKEAVLWIEGCGNKDITLLHCTSNYPTQYQEVNMNAMLTLEKELEYPIGYSDHTEGIIIPVMAAAMGASVIEKHFTLDKNMEGPDHKASLNVSELSAMVKAIRTVEKAKGNGVKQPAQGELSTRIAARKSLVCAKDLKKGTVLGEKDLGIKRPGNGVAPKYMQSFVGKKLTRDIKEEEMLQWEDVE